MLQIPQITEKQIERLKCKKIVVHGFHTGAKQLYEMCKCFGIEVVAFCSDARRDLIKRAYQGVPIVPVSALNEIATRYTDVTVISFEFEQRKIQELRLKLEILGIEMVPFSTGQLMFSFAPMMHLQMFQNRKIYQRHLAIWEKTCKRKKDVDTLRLFLKNAEELLFICLPMKTADHTLNETFYAAKQHAEKNQNFLCKNVYHKPRYINRALFQKRFHTVKIITGVREPIAQNLSVAYQEFGSGTVFVDWFLGELSKKPDGAQKQELERLQTLFSNQGDKANRLWQAFIERYVYPTGDEKKKSEVPRAIQNFIPEFKENVLDLLAYPFDQEKGYAIIKEGNVEVFVYQLEKLNHIVPELSQWVGLPFDDLHNGNQAADKWVGESYKQALQEIALTQEYFDRCFDEPYVKHFYSAADIEKFKAKWRSHIK